MRINYDFNDLEAFLAVKDTGSFHSAGERLNLSQSAVTRRVQKLETALGSQLFERTTRAVKPTLAAKRLQPRAEAILADAAETAQAMRDESIAFDYQRSAVITVACIPTLITQLVAPAIRSVTISTPNLRVRLLDGSANEVAEAVAGGEADFGLGAIAMLEPTTDFEVLLDDEFVLAVPHGHALAGMTLHNWRDAAQSPIILPARGTGNRLLIDEAFAKLRISIDWTFEASRTSTALDLVRDSVGLALVPKSAVAQDHPICHLQAPQISRPVGLVSRLGQVDMPAALALKAAIRKLAQL